MSKMQPRRLPLRRVPPIEETQEEEWLGAEAHVRPQERPIDWVHVFRTVAAGHQGVVLGLAFLGGLALGSVVVSLIARSDKD